MKLYESSATVKYLLIFFLVALAIGSFIYTQFLIDQIRQKERLSVDLWAKAIEYTYSDLNAPVVGELNEILAEIDTAQTVTPVMRQRWRGALEFAKSELENIGVDFIASEIIIRERFEIPSLVIDEEGNIPFSRNLEDDEINEETREKFATINEPITITIGEGQRQEIYYGESALVTSLRYFPYVQFGLLALFLGMGYYSMSIIRHTEQSKLWVGMAKESAHQLGTPISSQMGWIALLREEATPKQLGYIHELEHDVERLQNVAERFNKIGSEPELKLHRVGSVLNDVIRYMQRRIPQVGRNVELVSHIETEARSMINPVLFTWALENLIKNSIDSLDKNAEMSMITIDSFINDKKLVIDVIDTGRGIPKRYFKQIFKPGFSTKKRGWGLGLSLSKRIIEDYHNGHLTLLKSQEGQGSTFRITLDVEKNGIRQKPN